MYYEQLDYVIETYTLKWLDMGFDAQTLENVADYCFKHGLRTLEAMNDTLKKFYKKGVVTGESIAEFVLDAARSDDEIKEIFEAAGVSRAATATISAPGLTAGTCPKRLYYPPRAKAKRRTAPYPI